MLRTLSGRIALLLFSGLCTVVVAYGVLAYRGMALQLDEANQKLNQGLARYLVETNKLARGDAVNRRALSKLFANLMSVNPNIEIYLLDGDGSILAYSAAEQRVKRKAVDLAPVREFIGGHAMYPLQGDDPRDLEREKVFSAAPLPASGTPEAYLYVVLGGEQYHSVADMLLQSRLLRTSVQTAGLAAAFLVVAWAVLFWSITRRLRRLTDRVAEFRESEPVPWDSAGPRIGDEIDQLDRTFTRMSARIGQQVEALKETDQARRELIANVSHDLRTPLTALHGYLETLLLKGPELSPVQQRTYLETASRSSRRLSKLVTELFELAKLESHAEPAKREAFDVSDLLQDVAAEFRIVAERHGVHLRTRIEEALPRLMGDIEMMERALRNLIQNAIHHTAPAGEVVVEATFVGAQVHMSVSDTGCGISAEDLPHVFDRFYKAHGAADNAEGAGLGLAIAQRIVKLHGGVIRARSEVGVGTRFAFSLSSVP